MVVRKGFDFGHQPAHFVRLDRLPLNANGKVDRTALPAPPEHAALPPAGPLTDLEGKVAALWRRILDCPVTLDDTFFDLGGSYDALTAYFGGRALHMTLDRATFTINPFCLPPTNTNLQFLFTFVRVLVQSGGQYAMTRADDQALYEQLETLYALDCEARRLFTLATILPRISARQKSR